MRDVVYLVAASLDGSIARADGSLDCFPTEGEHADDCLNSLNAFDDVLMGRRTYEVGLAQGVTNPYPRMKSWVFSRTMRESPHENVRIISGHAVEFVADLKNKPGRDIYLCGGSELAATLLEADLVDRVEVKLNPLLIGAGIPLFARVAQPLPLEIVRHRVYSSGVALLSYRVKHPGAPG